MLSLQNKKYLYIAIAIVYFLMPWDILHDAIPRLGKIDDLIVAYLAYRKYRDISARMRQAFGSAEEKAGAGRQGASGGQEQPGGSKSDSEPFDPYKVLEINRGATQEEIESAYRTLAAKYHPDKVNHLGAELQKLAHEKMIDIQKAYRMLKR